ncbi:MAG: AI-2E family transporter [Candidatus Eremiobacteraeota bacterium]|nr:AI-2E family transporter [Candidatus Eremiobacteraeota bacterium]
MDAKPDDKSPAGTPPAPPDPDGSPAAPPGGGEAAPAEAHEDHPNTALPIPKWFYWILAALGCYILYRVNDVLMPFIVSFVVAYFLDPFVDYLERRGNRRIAAILKVYLLCFLIIALFFLLVVPPVFRQMRQIERNISRYLDTVHEEGEEEYNRHLQDGPQGTPQVIPPPLLTSSPAYPTAAPPAGSQPSASTGSLPVPSLDQGSPSPSPASMAPLPSSKPASEPLSKFRTLSDEEIKEKQKENMLIENLSFFWLGLTKRYPVLREHFGDEKSVVKYLQAKQEEIAGYSVRILSGISNWALSSLSHVIALVLVPILTFYFLCVIDPLKERLLFLIGHKHYKRELIQVSHEINVMLVNYLKGQVVVSFLVGVTITIGASLVSLFFHTKYSLLLGCLTGVTCIIPYFGAVVSTLMAFLIGLFTASHSHLLAALFMVGMMLLVNQLFDNVITPRIVGEQVGLHPLWTLFALLAGGKLLGFLGMLIAVPIAASIKICLIRIFPRLVEPVTDDDDGRPEGPAPPDASTGEKCMKKEKEES